MLARENTQHKKKEIPFSDNKQTDNLFSHVFCPEGKC